MHGPTQDVIVGITITHNYILLRLSANCVCVHVRLLDWLCGELAYGVRSKYMLGSPLLYSTIKQGVIQGSEG